MKNATTLQEPDRELKWAEVVLGREQAVRDDSGTIPVGFKSAQTLVAPAYNTQIECGVNGIPQGFR